jgi:16S rRNA (cytosine1407-C5)-methyltransferase
MISQAFTTYISSILPSEELEEYFNTCQRPLKKSLTINPTKISPEQFEHYAREHGWTLEKHPFLEQSYSYYIDRDDTSIALGNHRMHQCGFFYIQEIAAATPAYLLDMQPWMLILDIAASPGGKTSQLANSLLSLNSPVSDMKNQEKKIINEYTAWLVIANDIDSLRIRTLEENLKRMGCRNTATTKLDGTKWGTLYPELFDAILVDAPCSGEGTAFKSDDALAHRRMEEIKKIAGLQKQILESAIHACKVGGHIIYSTCTLNSIENEWVLGSLLKKYTWIIELEKTKTMNTAIGYEQEDFSSIQTKYVARFWPHLQKTGWFFVCRIKKIASSNQEKKQKDTKITVWKKFNRKIHNQEIKHITQLLHEYYGIFIDRTKYVLFLDGDTCFITSAMINEIDLPNIQAGIPIAKYIRTSFIPHHALWQCLWHLATKNNYSISEDELQLYVEKKEIPHSSDSSNIDNPFIILQYQNIGIGIGKIVGSIIKSKYL